MLSREWVKKRVDRRMLRYMPCCLGSEGLIFRGCRECDFSGFVSWQDYTGSIDPLFAVAFCIRDVQGRELRVSTFGRLRWSG